MKGRQCAGERREPGPAGVTAAGEETGRPAGPQEPLERGGGRRARNAQC